MIEAPSIRPDAPGTALDGAGFEEPPAGALRARSYAAWGKALAQHLYEHGDAEILCCRGLKVASQPGETEGDFRARLQHELRERRDGEVAKLRAGYAARLQTLGDQVRRAEERVAREQQQYSQSKLNTAISVGAGLLGALLGGRRAGLGKIGSAARSAGRATAERADGGRAEEGLDVLRHRHDEMARQVETEIAALAAAMDPQTIDVERIKVVPRKSDITVGRVFLAWEPR